MNELVSCSAVQLTESLRSGAIGATELLAATYEQIGAWNPHVNAIVSLRDLGDVMADAAAADERRAAGGSVGPLHGLPMAVKDLSDVRGIPTRAGSSITPDKPAQADSPFVSRLRDAGAIFVGKTNTPEFGVGSHTFNDVFGLTRNPYDLSRSAGGSSGGAAAALAARMVALADGSDLGGSLRNPGAFNNVIGFRPSIGRVPTRSKRVQFMNRFALEGPMARSIADLALLLSVMAGPDRHDPRSLPEPGSAFASIEPADPAGLRVAWGGDLGLFRVEAETSAVAEAAAQVFDDIGASVDGAHPDLAEGMHVFRVFRAFRYLDLPAQFPGDVRSKLKATLRENIAVGEALGLEDLLAAERARIRIHEAMLEFFDRYDVLALPTTQVAPFPAELEYPTEIEGEPMADYLDWMSSCCVITATGCPAISMPAGFTGAGLPIGLQLVAAPGSDRRLLEIAAAFEAATRFADVAPTFP